MSAEVTALANGLRIVTEAMPGLGSVALGVFIEAGSRHEDACENGIAHFLEHMAFKGTGSRSALDIAEQIEDVGGQLNAFTARDMTGYHARVLPGDAALALEIIADILRDPLFEDGEIETERGVILSEIGQALDTPDDIIFDWLQETAYPDQPLGRAILGPPERVRAFTRADLGRFVARHYAPGRMIVSAAGAVEHDRIVALAERLFADMEPGPGGADRPARFTGGERRVDKPLEQAHFAFALPAPSYRDAGYHAAQILGTALGGGMSSRLFQEARERRGLCYTIFAHPQAWTDTGLMTIYAGTGAETIRDLAELTMAELARAREDLTEAEIARARAQTRAGLVMGLESPSARAERNAALLSIWGRVPDLAESLSRIDAVDAAAARDAAARIAAQPPALALYGPVARAPSADALARLLAA